MWQGIDGDPREGWGDILVGAKLVQWMGMSAKITENLYEQGALGC